MIFSLASSLLVSVAPVRERGLKWKGLYYEVSEECVAPVRERGLKFAGTFAIMLCHGVAPVRERGLKSDMRGGGRCR